jgi:hypothetical protein
MYRVEWRYVHEPVGVSEWIPVTDDFLAHAARRKGFMPQRNDFRTAGLAYDVLSQLVLWAQYGRDNIERQQEEGMVWRAITGESSWYEYRIVESGPFDGLMIFRGI